MSDFTIARRKMVDGQIRPSDVTDQSLIEAFLAIPRELFLPESKRALAYLDLDVEVGESKPVGSSHLIKPAVIARMLQAVEIAPTDNVLIVGCASGYLAAIVARLCGPVTAIESDPSLITMARAAFAKLDIQNVDLRTALPTDGAPDKAPFDVIVLGGATEVEPAALYKQLRENGRLVGVFASARPSLAMIVTHSHNDFGTRALFDATIPVLDGLKRSEAFVF